MRVNVRIRTMCSDVVFAAMCIRCQQREAPQALDYCASCGLEARLEVARGLRELADYLGVWPSFDDWLRGHPEPS